MQISRIRHGLSNRTIFQVTIFKPMFFFNLRFLHVALSIQAITRSYSDTGVTRQAVKKVATQLTQDNYTKQYQWKGWRWNVGTDWKIAASIIVAVTSYYVTTRLDRVKLKKEMRLDQVENQIQKLYGPLYGNRLVSSTSYRAVMKKHDSLQKYLHEARVTKDADMIRRWRSFVMDVLYPLDKAAVELILNNAHLITHGEFPEEFINLLVHTARMEFVMQHWKSEDGKLEPTSEFTEDDYLESNNSSGMRGRSRALVHAKVKYENLREEQKRLSLEIGDYQQTDGVLLALVRKLFR